MILHTVGITGCLLGIKLMYNLKYAEERFIKAKWKQAMIKNNLVNKDTKETFELNGLTKEPYGYSSTVSIPSGFSYSDFDKVKDVLKDTIGCLIETEKKPLQNTFKVKIVRKNFESKVYKPLPLNNHTLFLGYDFAGEPITVDMNRFPHLLIAGATGTGKSRLAFIILTNLIATSKDIDIYLTQIRKRDLKKFKDCIQVKGYAEDEAQASKMFTDVAKIINERVELLDRCNCENIEEYNKKHKNKLKYVFVFGDEFSFFMQDKTDDEETSEHKEVCLSKIKEIIKTGRSVGVFLIIGLQRTTAEELLPIVKSQMRAKVSFSQTNKISSQNIIECDEAYMLPEREFILLTNKLQHARTPQIEAKMIEEYIKSSKVQNVKHKPNNEAIATFTWGEVKKKNVTVVDYTNYGQLPKRKKGVLKNVN